MKIRRCTNGEMEKILMVADKAFSTDRYDGFTFKKSMPSIYANEKIDYSCKHFVVENENGEFVAVLGNLLDKIEANSNFYKFSRIGSVGVIKNYRNLGYMKNLMKLAEEENIKEKVIFSILTGKRNRYNNYGYERLGYGLDFVFDKNQEKYLPANFDIKICEFNEKDFNEIYTIYKKNQKFVLRNKENFLYHNNNSKNKLFVLKLDEKIIGYFDVNNSTLTEINLIDNKYLENTVRVILKSDNLVDFEINKHKDKLLHISSNILEKEKCKILEKICDYKTLTERYNIKVYNLIEFVKMLFELNDKLIKDVCENYIIGNKEYQFSVKNTKLTIIESDIKNFKRNINSNVSFKTINEFLRFSMGMSVIDVPKSFIFPLYFSLNSIDEF